MRAAKSQSKTGHPDARKFAADLLAWERYGYYQTSKEKAEKQQRVSLALGATEVSRKKVLNATICLPQTNEHFWLPPMDCASSIFPHFFPLASKMYGHKKGPWSCLQTA